MLSKEDHQTIARTIYEQLGGRKFGAMVGANNLLVLSDMPHGGLQVSFRGSRKANMIRVIVDERDTYTLEFWKISRPRGVTGLIRELEKLEQGWKPQPVKVWVHVYDDMLVSIFKEFTVLETSLGTLGG